MLRNVGLFVIRVPKHDLINADVEKTEYMLFDQKVNDDVGAIDVFVRSIRNWANAALFIHSVAVHKN